MYYRLNIGGRTGVELAQAFSAIPASVTILDLSANELYRKTGVELAQIFSVIPTSVTSLDLRGMHLIEKQAQN